MGLSDWNAMGEDERRAHVAEGIEAGNGKRHLSAPESAGTTGPVRADPTDGQRENVRKADRAYARETHEFGETMKTRFHEVGTG